MRPGKQPQAPARAVHIDLPLMHGLLIILLGLMLATPAKAHAVLDTAVPAEDSLLPEAPRELILVFTQPIEPKLLRISLTGPHGRPLALAAPSIRHGGMEVVVALPQLLSGTYRVEWRVVSVDTHPSAGNYNFQVK
jgi:methionine-rich copper-binding protein CopC